MSYRYFLASSRIQHGLALLDRLPEVRVLDRGGHYQVYRPTKELLERFAQAEIGVGVGAGRERIEVHQEIEVAVARTVPTGRRGAEQLETTCGSPDCYMARRL